MIISERRATLSASSNSCWSVRSSRFNERPNIVARSSYAASLIRLLPLAYMIFAFPAVISFRPSTNEGERSSTAATLHVPGIFVRLLASGPITAILPLGLKGNSGFPLGFPSGLSFFNKTKLSAAILRAASRWALVKMSRAGRFGSQYL